VLLRHAVRADLETIVDIWVDAFTADPYLRWIQPDDAQWPAFGRAWMTFISDLAFERGHTFLADPADVAVAWIPPDLSLVGSDDIERGRMIIATHAGEAKADDALTAILQARAHTLDVPHWTLQYIGVRTACRGTGTGAAAVAPGLRVCDDEQRRCGLVSSNPRNVSFYERLGFRVTAEVSTPDAATTLRPMHRAPVIA
jgi:ribosomal protein S18 acetylase RimI-like enzyme